MAFIRERTRTDGTPYFSVTYRVGGRGSRQWSTSFPDEKEAKRFCALVNPSRVYARSAERVHLLV